MDWLIQILLLFHQCPITDELIDIQHRTFWCGAWKCLLMLEEEGHNKGNRSWGFWLIGTEREWSLGVARNCPSVRKSPSFESQEAYASQLSMLLSEFWYCRKMQVFSSMLWHCMCTHDNMVLQSLHWVPRVTMLHHPSPGLFLIQYLKTPYIISLNYAQWTVLFLVIDGEQRLGESKSAIWLARIRHMTSSL